MLNLPPRGTCWAGRVYNDDSSHSFLSRCNHNKVTEQPPVQPVPITTAPAAPAPRPKGRFCQWLEEKKIEVTIPLVVVSFKLPLTCKSLLIVLGLVLGAALILLAPRLLVNRCAYPASIRADQEAIVWLINAEGEAVVGEDMGTIRKIFAPDAVFVDMLTQEKWFSPVERYTHLFAAANFSAAIHVDIKAVSPVSGERAFFTSGSRGSYTASGVKGSYSTPPDSDHWTLEKRGGCWVISQFDFNASGIPFP